MRIVTGKLKGSNLFMPKDKNTRPLKDVARESIFNLLIHSNKILFEMANTNILDLYAGTGSFGLECLSRDAENVYFVEKNRSAIDILKKNIEKLKVENKTKILIEDVFSLIEKSSNLEFKFDLIFCDPPFKDKNVDKLIKLIFKKNLLNKNGILILHRDKSTKENLPDCFKLIDDRLYGESKIIFGKFLS